MVPDFEHLDAFWDIILKRLEPQINKKSFKTWLLPTKLIDYHDNKVVLSAPDNMVKDWLVGRYYDLIKNNIQSYTNTTIELVITIEGVSEEEEFSNSNHDHAAFSVHSSPLNPKYTFQTFVIGNGNRFAHAAALAVAESPAKSYNPLFIYGGSGLGKTHLMHAIGHQIRINLPHLKIVYVTGERFTNELIDSIRYETQVEFRNTYRKVDVLLIDDIQFLAGKEGTQEEFFHTFNTLYEANKQIIISSDRPPREIPTLEERLRSRFEMGLTTDINPPDYETRIAILRKKAQIEDFNVPEDVINFIAFSIQSNIRELEGALSKITAYCTLTDQKITISLAEEILKDMLPQNNNKNVSADLIMKIVADHYKISLPELKQKNRSQHIALPRQISMYLCRELTELSLPQIGEKFGGRDHTTVMHSYDKIKNLKSTNSDVEKTLNELINDIRTKQF